MTIPNFPRANADLFPTLRKPDGNVVQLKRLSHRHLAIMDFMLAHPTLTMSEIAEHFKVTPAWLSTMRHSDLFKARLAERRAMMDEDQTRRITEKMMKVAEHGAEALLDIVQDEEQDGRIKLDATKAALESIGFLGKASGQGGTSGQGGVQVNIDMGSFEKARELASQGHQARPLIEGEKE